MLNKKGYVMVYAIGVIALLMVLTATLTNITMTRSNWTNKQVYNIQESSLARTQVEAAASDLSVYLDEYINEYNKYLYELNDEFESIFVDIETRYGVEIRDLTKDSCVYPTNPDLDPCYPIPEETPDSDKHTYTYAYDIVYEGKNLVAQKRFFLSMIPSFLYFALGSKTDLTINGGAYIDGDMYVNRNLYLSDTTNYKVNSIIKNQPTSFSTVSPITNLYFSTPTYNLYSCRQTVEQCYDLSGGVFQKNIDTFLKMTNSFEYSTTFVEEPPKVKTYSDKFLDVDFDASFIYYINDAIDDKFRDVDIDNLETELNTFVSENRLYVANTIEEINFQDTQSVLIKDPPVIKNDLAFNKKEWIIVDGNLSIENYDNSNPPIFINANFLVTGNITISGNVQFNSTSYVLGHAAIHNANINNENALPSDNQLVLLSKQDIQFSRINEFLNTFSGLEIDPITDDITIHPNIRGFFFTDSNLQIYTVNSYLTIEGGIFSNDTTNLEEDVNGDMNVIENVYITQTDSIGLLINAYRGEVNSNPSPTDPFSFSYSDYYKKARFIISHNSDIIRTQPKGLPLNKQLNYLFEDITIKRL
ncbi:hypothetical protein KHQ81_05620 [Mycoplasmatota bacterium]|nr:hypothetical protein KHQ81_05620 [Mycoplasmatota bacterium]